MSEEINLNNDYDKQISFPYLKITFIFTLILCLVIPSRFKINKTIFFIGFVISALIMNFLFSFFKVLYYDKNNVKN